RYSDSRGGWCSGGRLSFHFDLPNEEEGASLGWQLLNSPWKGAMFRKQRHVFVYNKTKETFLSFRVEVKDSVWGRLVGLLGKRSLPPGGGAWIVPANA